MMLKTLPLLGSIACLSALGYADETEVKKSDLEGIDFGEHIYGPKVDLDSLKGRVVLIEYWGRN
jgi:hypothetical protein